MKRLLFCSLLVLFLLSLTACSGNAGITGDWEQEIEINILGAGETGTAMAVVRFSFREDGTGTQEHIISDGKYRDVQRDFSYSLDKDILTLDYGENHAEEFTIVLGENSLKLENHRGIHDLIRVE